MELSEKKIQIIEAVERLLHEKGTSSLSVREIAAAAGINIAMISYYFGSKDQIIETIVNYRYSTEKAIFLEEYKTIQKEPDIKTRLGKVVDLYADKTFLFKSLQRITEENSTVANKCRPDILAFHFTLVEIFDDIIKDGIENKTFKPKADIHMLVGSVVGTLLFFLKSRVYVQEFVTKAIPEEEQLTYLNEKVRTHLKTMIFLMLGNE